MGGLIKTNVETTVKKVPFLGDIPFVGAIFRHKDNVEQERELIVFITPHILYHEGEVAKARVDAALPGSMPIREQSSRVLRNEEIDNTLERWEN